MPLNPQNLNKSKSCTQVHTTTDHQQGRTTHCGGNFGLFLLGSPRCEPLMDNHNVFQFLFNIMPWTALFDQIICNHSVEGRKLYAIHTKSFVWRSCICLETTLDHKDSYECGWILRMNLKMVTNGKTEQRKLHSLIKWSTSCLMKGTILWTNWHIDQTTLTTPPKKKKKKVWLTLPAALPSPPTGASVPSHVPTAFATSVLKNHSFRLVSFRFGIFSENFSLLHLKPD